MVKSGGGCREVTLEKVGDLNPGFDLESDIKLELNFDL